MLPLCPICSRNDRVKQVFVAGSLSRALHCWRCDCRWQAVNKSQKRSDRKRNRLHDRAEERYAQYDLEAITGDML